MKCIIFKNKKKFWGSENWAPLISHSWLVWVWLLLLFMACWQWPAAAPGFAKLQSAQLLLLEMALSCLAPPAQGCWQHGQHWRRNDQRCAKEVGQCTVLPPHLPAPRRLPRQDGEEDSVLC